MARSPSPLILGLETSCDDTGVALLRGKTVLAHLVSSQFQLHKGYRGIHPILAARAHEQNLPLLLQHALETAQLRPSEIDAIAVTAGPGNLSYPEVLLRF
jgi:N6-L-threonylcarbamoyladenine synthase